MSRRIEVIGGGPSGLYVARLLKLAQPALDVVVHERLGGDDKTFGFGVGLTESTMKNLTEADPETAEQIRDASFAGHTLDFLRDDDNVTLHGARNLAIGRATLLRILTDAAARVGVEISTGVKADAATTGRADVVIAADGVRSSTRAKLRAELGVAEHVGRTRFVWCGADFAVESAFFAAAERPEGLFVAHAYPYADDRSTFLIEVDEDTWQSANLADLDAGVPAGQTDQASVEILNRVFADALRGRPLLTNRTRWGRFTTLTLDRWSAGNTVLIGDAAHTAHYTLGSGTKLALEDSIALADALHGEASVAAAFAAYENVRRPPVERFKRLAGRSQAWWDSYRIRANRPVRELALSYMTRAGNLGIEDYAREQLADVRVALEWLGGEAPKDPSALDNWVLGRPMELLNLPSREIDAAALESTFAHEAIDWNDEDVWNERADVVVQSSNAAPSTPLIITGPNDLGSIGARIDLAERIRLQANRPVGVRLPEESRKQAAAAVGAGRADFIVRD